jgi:predicted chitinase
MHPVTYPYKLTSAMREKTIWGYRAGYTVRLGELETLYDFQPGKLLKLNPYLRDVYRARAGDLIFLPIQALDREGLRNQFPHQAGFLLEDIQVISPYEASLVQAGASTRIQYNADNFVSIDRRLLQAIMDRCAGQHIKSHLNLDVVADALNRAMQLALVTNRRREVGFLSQAVIETDYFRTFEEYGKGSGKEYGIYYGRGMHQLTWKETYAACSKAVFNDDRLVNHPEQVANDIEVNIKATAWYWRDYKPFNSLADDLNVDEIIHKLYGGTVKSQSPTVRHSVELRRSFYVTIQMALNQRHDQRL